MKRGRKQNDDLPPSRSREVQRAFRARRAQYISDLEKRVSELEAENVDLKERLSFKASPTECLAADAESNQRPQGGPPTSMGLGSSGSGTWLDGNGCGVHSELHIDDLRRDRDLETYGRWRGFTTAEVGEEYEDETKPSTDEVHLGFGLGRGKLESLAAGTWNETWTGAGFGYEEVQRRRHSLATTHTSLSSSGSSSEPSPHSTTFQTYPFMPSSSNFGPPNDPMERLKIGNDSTPHISLAQQRRQKSLQSQQQQQQQHHHHHSSQHPHPINLQMHFNLPSPTTIFSFETPPNPFGMYPPHISLPVQIPPEVVASYPDKVVGDVVHCGRKGAELVRVPKLGYGLDPGFGIGKFGSSPPSRTDSTASTPSESLENA